jgi:hypothetical protein
MTKAVGFFALIWLSMPLLVRSGQADDPMGCAMDMSNLVEVITTASADITFSTEDCTPPGLSELDCSADIIDAVQQMANVASTISSATLTCGGIDNNCATEVAQTIADFSDFPIYLISAAADCAMAPFNCVVDVFEAINSAMAITTDIYAAIADCNPTPVLEYDQPDMDDMDSYNAAVASLGLDPDNLPSLDDGTVERRLAGDGPVHVLGQQSPGQAEGWKRHIESAREKIASWRKDFTSLGINTESAKIAELWGEAEAQARRLREAAAPSEAFRVAVEANEAVGRRLRQVLNSTASLAAAGTVVSPV